MEDFYIAPYIATFRSLDDLEEKDPDNRFVFNHKNMEVLDFDKLNAIGKAFIISEPGYGKSLLMKKLAAQIDDRAKVLSIDCKVMLDRHISAESLVSERINHLYFDGLDEVPPLQFLEALQQIGNLTIARPDLNIYVACRTHYLKRWKTKLKDFIGFKYVVIQQFADTHIRKYLEHFITDEEIIELIMRRSSGSSRDPVLKTPRYLDALVRSILDGQWTAEELRHITRIQIFDKVVYYKLISEIKKQHQLFDHLPENKECTENPAIATILSYIRQQQRPGSQDNEVHITQRVLEKLALIMEIYQRNQISHEELITYLDETRSNINQIFLQNSSIDVFIERVLKRIDFNYLKFENTEHQEYLAAKELIRMSNSEQVLYDLIMDKKLDIVYSSWYDVIQYAIELDPQKVAGSLSNLLAINPGHQVEERLIDLLLGPGMDQAEPSVKGNIFQIVFIYYQHCGQNLYQKDTLLANLYKMPENQYLISLVHLDGDSQLEITRFVNRMLIIKQLANKGLLTAENKAAWREYLLFLLHRPALGIKPDDLFYVLESLDAKAEVLVMYTQIRTEPDGVVSTYLNSLGNIAPDEAVDIFVDIIQQRPKMDSKERFLDNLTSEAAISKVFDLLLKEPQLIDSLFNDNWSHIGFYSLFDRIAAINSGVLNAKTEDLFQVMSGGDEYTHFRGPKEGFMKRAVTYLLKQQPGFFERLLKLEAYENLLRELAEPLANLITVDQFEIMEAQARNSSMSYYDLYKLVTELKRNASYIRKPVIEEMASKFPKLFEDQKTTDEASLEAKQKQEAERVYREFLKKLLPEKKEYYQDVFAYYLINFEKIECSIKPSEKEKIKNILRMVIDKVDPDEFRITLTKEESKITSHVNNTWWFHFGLYIRLALLLNEEDVLRQNRSKLIKYLPMLKDYKGDNQLIVEHVTDHLGPITAEDEQILLNYCVGRDDDYILGSVSVFTEMIKIHRLLSFKPVLKQIISSSAADLHEKEIALKTLGELSEEADYIYLEEVFDGFNIEDKSCKLLGELANEILITRFKDHEAISWRFEQLKSRVIVILEDGDRQKGLRPYPDWEYELDKPKFGRCLYGLNGVEIQSQIIDLLKYALMIRKTAGHNRYSKYLMDIVYDYFTQNNSLKIINALNALLTEPTYSDTAGNFKGYVVKLEKNLSDTHVLYKTISEPIRIYNEIQERKYLPIYNSIELASLVEHSIIDLESFIHNKGFYQTAMQLSGAIKSKKTSLFNEDVLQKTLAVTMENSLLRNGLRNTDINREIELNDGQRIDLLIKYGFIGPVMVELKLLHNPEIQNDQERARYKSKLIKYMEGINAEYTYYLVFKVRNGFPNHLNNYEKLVQEYNDIPALEIKLLDCAK
ncbi:hypothetical protein [Mucilaginibacter sp. NFX135]|uniref:NACHT domain-containing protein n=1 Tax=Mucilaginibacter sp. NFX135 TaxID=3402687 RepID=UPI003AFA9222